jgi:hypothetical protein
MVYSSCADDTGNINAWCSVTEHPFSRFCGIHVIQSSVANNIIFRFLRQTCYFILFNHVTLFACGREYIRELLNTSRFVRQVLRLTFARRVNLAFRSVSPRVALVGKSFALLPALSLEHYGDPRPGTLLSFMGCPAQHICFV